MQAAEEATCVIHQRATLASSDIPKVANIETKKLGFIGPAAKVTTVRHIPAAALCLEGLGSSSCNITKFILSD